MMSRVFTPRKRHREDFYSGSTDALIAAVCIVGGVLGVVALGKWWMLVLVLAGLVIARDAYIKYKIGRWLPRGDRAD
jgi:fatty acid desaturase